MQLPPSVLARVRGPIALLALVGCGSPAAAPASVTSEPVEAVAPVAVVVPDPVSYDDTREAERLARLDEVDTRSADARDARIERSSAHARAERERAQSNAIRDAFGTLDDQNYSVACGRG